MRAIDFKKTILKKSVIIPNDLEYHGKEENKVEAEQIIAKNSPFFLRKFLICPSKKPKLRLMQQRQIIVCMKMKLSRCA